MSDQFDKKLVNRINEVFDNFEDDSANEGWVELRKQFPGKSARRSALWWFSSAAAILLICGVWFFSNQQTHENEDISKVNPPVTKYKTDVNEQPLSERTANPPAKQKQDQSESPIKFSHNNKFKAKPIQKQLAKVKANSIQEIKTEIDAEQETAPSDKLKENSEHDLMLMALVPKHPIRTDSAITTTASVNETSAVSALQASTNDNSPLINNNNYPTEVLANDKLSTVASRKARKENSKSNKNITLGFFAGSYFNYAEGSKTSMNSGVGVSSEIKISKKLKVSTGISLAQNSLKYDQLIPQEAAMDFSSSSNKAQFDQYYNSPALTTSSVSYSINSYDAKLLGLDIPVNLKYTLIEKKNTIYIITGFSSNFFIDESYTYAFDYKMSGNSITNVPNQESSSNFQSFDFARVLNFSVGVDYPLNNKSRLSFEPFIKYPLSGLGAHDLKFGAAGINLKLNFNRLK